MTDLQTVYTVLHSDDENWDDLPGYCPEDLQARYMISNEAAQLLWLGIQARTDQRYSIYSMPRDKASAVLGNIQEALHQSLDGWTEEQQVVIEAFLADLALAANSV